MAVIKKVGSGDHYICKYMAGHKRKFSNISNIFLIRDKGHKGEITLSSTIGTPKELIGKRIMLRVEIL